MTDTLHTRQRIVGDDHPDTLASLNSLANLYQADSQYARAEPLLLKVIESRRRLSGAQNPLTTAAQNNLAEMFRRQGKTVEAEDLFNQVLDARRSDITRRASSARAWLEAVITPRRNRSC